MIELLQLKIHDWWAAHPLRGSPKKKDYKEQLELVLGKEHPHGTSDDQAEVKIDVALFRELLLELKMDYQEFLKKHRTVGGTQALSARLWVR